MGGLVSSVLLKAYFIKFTVAAKVNTQSASSIYTTDGGIVMGYFTYLFTENIHKTSR